MEEASNNPKELSPPERPLECSGECRRPIQVLYTEIVGKSSTTVGMCSDCPVLRQKLHGGGPVKKTNGAAPAELVCGSCGLTMDEVRMGATLGCPLCYEIFSEEIVRELMQLERLPIKCLAQKRGEPLHKGKTPGKQQIFDPSLQLITLQQALHETLGREDYEQAALLRDQIRKIEESAKDKERGFNDNRTI